MFGRTIAQTLKRGEKVEAESFDCVTLFFSDITGFLDFTVESTPVQVVDLLNTVYSTMDDVILRHNVYKVTFLVK